MPVAIQLMLQFTETTFLTKDDFKGGEKGRNVNRNATTGRVSE